MKITICGSIAFFDEMRAAETQLLSAGHEVKLPPSEIKDDNGQMIPVKEYYRLRKAAGADDAWIWDRKAEAMRNHFDKVTWSDVILVLNYDKNDVENYIGANTFLEMGLAFHQGKNIFLLNPIPDLAFKEELLGMRPVVLDGDLGRLG